MKRVNTEKYKNFREFYWRFALVRIGLLWACITALVEVALRYKQLSDPLLRKDVIIDTLAFIIITSPLFAYGFGKGLWNNAKNMRTGDANRMRRK